MTSIMSEIVFKRNDALHDFINSFIKNVTSSNSETVVFLKNQEDIPDYEKNKNLYFIFMRDYKLEMNAGILKINVVNSDGYSDDEKQCDAIRLRDMIIDGRSN